MPDVVVHPVPLQPGLARLACNVTWRARPGRTARARSCSAVERAAALGYGFKMGIELEFFLVARATTADRAARRARHARAALLRHAGPDAEPRLHLDAVGVTSRAGLGQLRQRPRGRQRPVRVELRLRRRADHVPTARSSSATWSRRWRRSAADGDVHAEAVRAPDRQRLPHPHEPVGAPARTCSAGRTTTRAAWACRSSPTSSSAA